MKKKFIKRKIQSLSFMLTNGARVKNLNLVQRGEGSGCHTCNPCVT
jgi:hypothetical protein